ncbi:MAG: DUF368 domain-containing protein [Bacteroidota bacterium]
MKESISLFLKGLAMGAANVIPGVSGGTIALITGIYEKLIFSLKSFDLKAISYLFSFKIRDLAEHVNFRFLFFIFLGVGVSIVSLAKLFKVILENPDHEKWLMAFFFGLILVSIYSVGRTVTKWNASNIIAITVGLIIAVLISVLTPASENASFIYLFLCGIVAICSMILPGLSGSFILIIMGNYKLIMVDAVSEFNMKILIPVVIGSVIGLVAFSQILGWVFKHYRDLTIASMTGFIIGSLSIIWPWKNPTYLVDETGQTIIRKGKQIVSGYEWYFPDFSLSHTWVAIGFILLGATTIYLIEKFANNQDASDITPEQA